MKGIADLVPFPAKAQILESTPGGVGVDPVRKYTLLGGAKLAGSSHDAAAVDPDGNTKSRSVLLRQLLGSQFRRTIKGNWRLCAETFVDPCSADAREPFVPAVESEGG